MAFDGMYFLPDIYTLAAVISSTLEGLLSEHPRRVEQVLPYFGAFIAPQSGDEMAARFAMMAARRA